MFNGLSTTGPQCRYGPGSCRTGANVWMDGCLYVHGRVLICAWMGAYMCIDGRLYMHGRVLIYAWTGAYKCMDGCLYYMDGCLAEIYQVSARCHLIHVKLNGPDSFADGLPLHISNGKRNTAVNSAPTGPSCTRTGIIYTFSFTSVNYSKLEIGVPYKSLLSNIIII